MLPQQRYSTLSARSSWTYRSTTVSASVLRRISVLLTTRSTASISPDGRTLLSAGDSNKVHLHHLSGSSRVTFMPITSLSLPPCPNIVSFSDYSSLTASFSTAFSANGSKFGKCCNLFDKSRLARRPNAERRRISFVVTHLFLRTTY